MNNTTLVIGIIVALGVGGVGGYMAGSSMAMPVDNTKIEGLTKMITADAEQMTKMGDIMVKASALLEERGVKYNDNDLMVAAKDLSVYGKKNQAAGKSMTEGNVMGMDM